MTSKEFEETEVKGIVNHMLVCMYLFDIIIITTDPVEGNAPHRSLLTRGSSALLPVVLEEEEEEREEDGGEGGELGEGGGESDDLRNNCKSINIIYTLHVL